MFRRNDHRANRLFMTKSRGTRRSGGHGRRRYLPGLDALEAREVLSTVFVTNTNDTGPGSLRQAVEGAASGDLVMFDPSLNGQTIKNDSGTIAITKDIQIVGPGKDKLTLDGHFLRMFRIHSGVTNVLIAGVTITGGHDDEEGGAIVDWGGENSTLSLYGVAFTHNSVEGDNARGGAVSKSKGTLVIQNCVFDDNTVESLPGHGDASGAAVFAKGRLIVNNSTFKDGLVEAGILPSQSFDTRGGDGRGGAIAYSAAKGALPEGVGRVEPGVFITGSTFINNVVYAGYGATLEHDSKDGGNAHGGAVSIQVNDVNGLVIHVANTKFQDNEAKGGSAGEGLGNDLPANGGQAFGAGLWLDAGVSTGLTFLVDQQSSFLGNRASGGNGDSLPTLHDPKLFHSRQAGDAHGGGIAIAAASAKSATFTIKDSGFASSATGGTGGWLGETDTDTWAGDAGGGYGGGVWIDGGQSVDSVFSIVSDTFVGSGAHGGFGGSSAGALGSGGRGGDAEGGGLDFHGGASLRGKLTVANSTFRDVVARAGDGGDGGKVKPVGAGNGVNTGGDSGDAYGGGIAIRYEQSDKAASFLLANLMSNCQADAWVAGDGGPSFDHYNGHGGSGGDAHGGAIFVDAGLASKPGFSMLGGKIATSKARGGRGGIGGFPSLARYGLGALGGDGGLGGHAFGGAIQLTGQNSASFASKWTLIDVAIEACRAEAGRGGRGGDGFSGGDGGQAGRAKGGGIHIDFAGAVTLRRCNIVDNDAIRGLGGDAGKGFIGMLDGKKGLNGYAYGPGMSVEGDKGIVEVVDTIIESNNSNISPVVHDPKNRVHYL